MLRRNLTRRDTSQSAKKKPVAYPYWGYWDDMTLYISNQFQNNVIKRTVSNILHCALIKNLERGVTHLVY